MTVELTPALRAFAAELALFEDAVHGAVGPWLLPLQRALGPMRVPHTATLGDPDGFSGLSRRGPYERLLSSEWLLALDEPDEFIRRAVMHEHVFLAPQYRDPGGATASIAVFDTGALALGAPRLAQLALLMVLSLRATRGHALFRFGVLQDPEARLFAFDVPALKGWLAARTWSAPMVNIEAWTARLRETRATDLWVVGAPATRPAAAALGAHAITIEEFDDRDRPVLEVRTCPRDTVGEVAVLVLPPVAAALRALRMPFARAVAPRTVVADSSELGRLSTDGRRLLITGADGICEALHIPGSINEPVGHTKRIVGNAAHIPVAIDMFARRPVVAFSVGSELVVGGSGLELRQARLAEARSLGGFAHVGVEVPETMTPDPGGAALMLHVTTATATNFHAWVIDRSQQLWELELTVDEKTRELGRRSFELREPRCANFTRLKGGAVGWISHMSRNAVTASPFHAWELGEGDLDTCLFAEGPSVAYRRGDHYLVCMAQDTQELAAPDAEVFGLRWRRQAAGPSLPVLLFVASDRRTIRSRGHGGDEDLFVAPADLGVLRYEPSCDRIVYLTVAEGRGVYSFERGAITWRTMPMPGIP